MTANVHHTIFRPDPARWAEWIARLWQGAPAPPDFELQRYLYLPGGPREGMVFLWTGGTAAQAWFERAIAAWGAAETVTLEEATPGMALAIARDLPGMEAWLRGRLDEGAVQRQLDLRRAGMAARTPEEASQAAAAWLAEAG
jgi:hypothetical protein